MLSWINPLVRVLGLRLCLRVILRPNRTHVANISLIPVRRLLYFEVVPNAWITKVMERAM